jgi:hypothetical protein
MSLDVALSELVPLRLVPSMLPHLQGGKPISSATVYRWVHLGLRTVILGGRRMTSRLWVEQFVENRTAAYGLGDDVIQNGPPVKKKGRKRRLEDINRQLDTLGV